MLFSNEKIATFINQHFEPTWQTVRPVPVVTIDFGDGTVVTRTLHGNIATYVCRSDGRVLDILPGLYDSTTYLRQLEQLRRLALFARTEARTEKLREYHQRQANSLREKGKPQYLNTVSRGVSITGREIGVKIVLEPERRLQSRSARLRHSAAGRPVRPRSRPVSEQNVPDAKLLDEDTRVNETVRRRLIHEYLAQHSKATPAEMTKWLYREVLKADLDDPYLGLGKLLFGHPPKQ